MIVRQIPASVALALFLAAPALAQQPAATSAASLSSPGAPAAPANTANPTLSPEDSPAAAEAHNGSAPGVPGGFAPRAPDPELAVAMPDPAVGRLLTRGAQVKDGRGVVVGHVSRIVKDPHRRTLDVVVQVGGRDVTMPVDDLSAEGRYLIARKSGASLR